MKTFPAYLFKIYKTHLVLMITGIALIVAISDYFTGPDVRFPIFYVIPVLMAAWKNKKFLAYGIAVALPLLRLFYYIPWHQNDPFSIMSVNALIRIFVLMLIAYLIDRTAHQQNQLKVLKGLLPICASCKKIRNEKGDYQQMESYITAHSQAKFSHTLCPECGTKLYSGFNIRQEKNDLK
jgi:hypothetical protein